MLDLGDFVHLPDIKPLIAELVASGPGLTIVAGLDPRPFWYKRACCPAVVARCSAF